MYISDMTATGTQNPTTENQTGAPDPRWLNDLEMAAWLGYVETQGDLLTALEGDLAETGLTLGDYQVFVYLTRSEDQSMRMCDLATRLQLSPSGLTRRLDGLVSEGWIERRGSESDRRVMLAVLTDSGRRKLALAAPHHVESVRNHIIDHLDNADLEAMARIFDKIRTALDA